MRRLAGTGLGACALLLLGCSGLLPRESATDSAFRSFEAAEAAFTGIERGRTTLEELRALGIDPRDRGVSVHPYTALLPYFLPHRGATLALHHPAVAACIRAREACELWHVTAERDKGRRTTAWILDALRFHRRKIRSGFQFEGLVLVVEGRATYALYRGRPRLRALDEQIRPLGPLQDGPEVKLSPIHPPPRSLVMGKGGEDVEGIRIETQSEGIEPLLGEIAPGEQEGRARQEREPLRGNIR